MDTGFFGDYVFVFVIRLIEPIHNAICHLIDKGNAAIYVFSSLQPCCES
jgi:hypothetical protein